MIAECYSADVYCDHEGHPYGEPGCFTNPDAMAGRNKRETDRERRKAGWVKINRQDICPICAKRILKADHET